MRPDADLTTPRRTSPGGALVAVLGLDQLRSLLPVVIVAASSGRFLLVAGAALVIGVVSNALAWWRRTWWFVDGVLHLDEGVLVRSQRRIPVERVQHVEIERKLRHQALGLSVVRVETAGGSGAEVRLDSIAASEAEWLRNALTRTHATHATGAPATAPTNAEVLVRLPPARLLLAGVTGPEVAAVLAALVVGLDVASDFGIDPGNVERVDASTMGIVVLLLVGFPLWFLTAGMIGVVRRWDLTATVDGEDLRVTYGLFRKAEFVVKLRRVQDVRIAHRLLLRPFGRADLRVRTAASGAGDQSRVDIPLLDSLEIDRVLERVLPAALPLPSLLPAPPGARRRAVVRGTATGALVGALLSLVLRDSGPVAATAIIVGATIGWARGVAYYRGLGAWPATSSVSTLHGRAGAFTRHHAIVPVQRVQSTGVRASIFQRRRGLATLRLDLAGAQVDIFDRDAHEAEVLAGAALDPGERTVGGATPR